MHRDNSFIFDYSIFTARKRSLGQGNIFTPVCHSVHTGGICLSAGAGAGADTPLRSACWEIRSTSGQYASYWNAILFKVFFAANLIPVNWKFTTSSVIFFCRSDFYDRKSGTLKQVFALNSLDSQLQSKLMVSLNKYHTRCKGDN